MYYNVKAFPDIFLWNVCFKNVLVGLREAKGDQLEKENEIKSRSLRFATYKNLYRGYIKDLGKETGDLSCILWKLRQCYTEANGQYVLYNDCKKDWLK